MSIANQITEIRLTMEHLSAKYHININELKLLAVSKTHPAEAIQAAYDAGITDFGESYLQEALGKINQLQSLAIIWHFIGPIQSNKTKEIAENFSWVQSVDRVKLLNRLNRQRPVDKDLLKVCIQVNFFEEPQKKGASLKELPQLLELANQLPNIELRGLMAIPPKTEDYQQQLAQYQQIVKCFKQYKTTYPQMDTLSIGMSNDLEAAIAAGSTMVRIGTALFGQRQ